MKNQNRVRSSVLRPLLALSRDLLQSDDSAGSLDLVGKTLIRLLRADDALLVVQTEGVEYVFGFGRSGAAYGSDQRHPLYRSACDALAGTDSSPLTMPYREVAAVPAASPTAALAVAWRDPPDPREPEHRQRVLFYLAELAAAAIGKIQSKTSLEDVVSLLERRVSSQAAEMAHTVDVHVRELARRDAVESQIRAMSLTDMLTGMNNRRGFFVFAEQAFKAAHRSGRPAAVIFADIDGLKRVNDELGHDVGDRLIQDAATVFQRAFREADIVARLGGDEFAALTMDDENPSVVLRRISHLLDAFNQSDGRPYQLSFSTGVVACDPKSERNLSDYLLVADQEMYRQKRARLH